MSALSRRSGGSGEVAVARLFDAEWHNTDGSSHTQRITERYARCMTQLVARVDDSLVAAVDDLVASGLVASRSEAMRLGLEAFVDEHRRRAVGEEIAKAYRSHPQTAEELAGLDTSTRALIEEEPW